MKIYSIETGNFMLDGGTMFGVVPKAIWEKLYPCNEKNLVNLSMRSMLVCDGDNNILIDTGLGENLDEKFKSIYFPNGSHTIDDSLINKGVTKDDITDVIVTHLHFDHCGGNVIKENGHFVPAFPNATYHISLDQWKSALSPNKKEKASFCHNHFLPLKESGQLQLIEKNTNISSNVNIRLFNGHTKGL